MTLLPPAVIVSPASPPASSPYYSNQNPPGYIATSGYFPQGYTSTSTAFSVTATRVYYVPFAVTSAHTFSGVRNFNSGTTANGQKCRIMIFAAGDLGPGVLVKSFGEITFGATSVINTLSSTWAAPAGIYWLAQWFDSATPVYGMCPASLSSGAGYINGLMLHHMLGSLGGSWLGTASNNQIIAQYVDTTYGAAPANAVLPTNSINQNYSVVTPVIPSVEILG